MEMERAIIATAYQPERAQLRVCEVELTEESASEFLEKHGWRPGPGGSLSYQWEHRTGTPMIAFYYRLEERALD